MPPPIRETGHNGTPTAKHGTVNVDLQRESSSRGAQTSNIVPQNSMASRPVIQSPQQIMRARYKQQMMPPRTWRQQEERRKQQEAVSQQRLAGSNSTMRAAAATAAKNNKPTQAQAKPAIQTSNEFSRSRSGSLEAAQSANRRPQLLRSTLDDTAQELQQPVTKEATPSPKKVRPVVQRRRSSQLSISRAAAVQAQATHPHHRRKSSTSMHSASSSSMHSDGLSSMSSKSEVSTSNPTSPSPGRQVVSNPSLTTAAATVPPSPASSSTSTSKSSSTTSLAGAPPPHHPASAYSVATRPPPTHTLRRGNRASLLGSQFGGVPAPSTSGNSIIASAAARASAKERIEVSPQEPLSSKFVSSLNQALRRELHERQETRTAKERVRDIQSNELEKILGTLASTESIRSVASDASGESNGSAKSSVPLQAARKSGSVERYKVNQQQSASQDLEREKKKASALSAALAAGGKAESEMTRIHMQVNLAVQNSLESASRRELMKRYRPTSHWSAPIRQFRRPPLKRLTTSDSTVSAQNVGESPTTPTTVKPWQLMPESDDAGDSKPSTPVTPSSSIQSFGSIPMHPSDSAENMASASSAPSLVKPTRTPPSSVPNPSPSSEYPPSPTFAKSQDTSKWKTWTQSVLNRQRGGPKSKQAIEDHVSTPTNVVPASAATIGRPTSSGPSATYMPPGLSGPPPVARQEPMLHTLRGRTMRNKRFNEEKPWKNHQGLYYLSEIERKRYEKLWAANRCTHLPFLYLNPIFEGVWHVAVARRFPQLYRKENSSDQESVKTNHSANSQLQASPKSWNQDRGDTASINSYLNNSRWAEHVKNLEAMQLPSASSTAGPSLLPYGTAEPIAVESVENMINAASLQEQAYKDSGDLDDPLPYDTDGREVSPVSLISGETGEIENKEVSNTKSALDDLQSIASSIEKDVDKQAEDVHGYVVSRLWRRSRLPEETLAEIWDLVDTNRDGTLDRSSFVVGMWLCDQCLYGRKLPARVPYEVWQSVGKLHLKVRFKQPKSKIWYMSRLPTFMGSAVGHTMHGGRQAVKKVVQTATS